MKQLRALLSLGSLGAALACSSNPPQSHGQVFGPDGSKGDALPSGDGSIPDTSTLPEASPDMGAPHEAGHDAGHDASDGAVEAAPDAAMMQDGSVCLATMAVFGGSSSAAFGAISNGGVWTVASLTGSVATVPAIAAFVGGYQAVFSLTTTNALQSTVYTSSWSPVAPIGTTLTAATPALAAVGAALDLVYLGTNTFYYYGAYTNGAWDSANTPVMAGSVQSVGTSPPSAAAAAGDLVLVQSGTDTNLYDQTFTTSWLAAAQIAGATVVPTIAPTVVAANGGASDLFVVFVHGSDYTLYWTARTSGTWSTPAQISATAYTSVPVALAALPTGKFALVYEGSDTKPYFSLFDPGASPAWTAPALLVASGPLLPSPPTVAAGVCGADAVAAYVQPSGVQIVTLTGGTWSAPAPIAGTAAMTYAVLATHP